MNNKVRLKFGDVNKKWHGRTSVFILENISFLELEKAAPKLKKHLAFVDEGLFTNVIDESIYNAHLAELYEMNFSEYMGISGMYFPRNKAKLDVHDIKEVGMARLIADTLTAIYNREIKVVIDEDCFMLDLGAGSFS